jgi:putative MATE family efflux protein
MSNPLQNNISRQIILLGIPIIFSNLSRVIMGLADMAMVSRLGSNALAAAGMGSLLLWVIMSMGIGLRTAVQTVSSRRLGQKKYSMCSNTLYNGIMLAIIISIPFTIIGVYFAGDICSLFLKDLEVIKLCSNYMVIGCFSFIFVLTGFVFQGFYAGIEEARVHMVVTITSNILNIYLNAGLIYGSANIQQYFTELGIPWLTLLWSWFPFPSWGVKGAAAATLIASIWMVVHYSFFLLKDEMNNVLPSKLMLLV